jgi:hypothetical protein
MYKGFNKNMQCRGYQYQEGKTYKTDKANLCEEGFHACENPLDIFSYYPPSDSIYREVDLVNISEQRAEDSKRVGKQIKIGAEINLKSIIALGIKFIFDSVNWSDKNETGYKGASQQTGDHGASQQTGYKGASQKTGDQGASQQNGD